MNIFAFKWNRKLGGRIPTTEQRAPFTTIGLRRIELSPLYLVRQRPSVMIVAQTPPGLSSSDVKVRPLTGATPRTWKRSADTKAVATCSGSLPPDMFTAERTRSFNASDSKLLLGCCRNRN